MEVSWPASEERPFELKALYRLTAPDTLDLTTSVTAHSDLKAFESFLASYFTEAFPASFVYALGDEKDTPSLQTTALEQGHWQAFPRDREKTEAAAAGLPGSVEIFDLDVTRPEEVERLHGNLASGWGGLDGALHAVAFAPRDALAGDFLTAGAEGVNLAFQTSAFSFATIGGLLKDLAPEHVRAETLAGEKITARLVPRMAFAPKADLFGVPSNSSSSWSIAICSIASQPINSSAISSFTWSTASKTPLPP